MKRLLILLMIGLVAISAQETGQNAFALLRTGYGASVKALGDAGTAWSGDITALWWNPAGLEALPQGEVMLGYRSFVAGIHDQFMGFAWPWRRITLGLGAFYSLTAVQGWDDNNEPTRKVYPQSGILDVGCAFSITRELSVGVGSKLLYENLIERTGTGSVFDLGVSWRPYSWMSLGVSLHDVGPGLYYDTLRIQTPWACDAGMSFAFLPGIYATFKGGYVSDAGFEGNIGVEYKPLDLIAIRIGGKLNRSVLEWGALAAPSGGVALYWKGFRVEYALEPYGVLGIAHTICISHYLKERPQTADVLVKVVDSGTLVPLDATVTMSGVIEEGVQKQNGTLRRNWITPGELGVLTKATHHYPGSDSIVLEPGKLNVLVVKLDSIPYGIVTGLVREEGSDNPADATVRFKGEVEDSVRTNPGWGTYSSNPLPPGEYLVKVEPDNPKLFPRLERIVVPAGDTLNSDLYVSREQESNILMTIRLNFETGKADILPGFESILDSIAPVLKDNADRGLKIEIAGHTDSIPVIYSPYGDNQRLSEARAEAVKSYLVGRCGLPTEMFLCNGYGDTHPLASNSTLEGRAMNRRIEFRLILK